MGVDLHASDPVFGKPGKKPGQHVDALMAYARERLGLGPDRPWKLLGSRGKLGKTLFEVEDEAGRRIIAKVSHSERAKRTFDTLTALWCAGMRPPSKCVVTEPVAWFPERDLLLQSKARGVQLAELIRARPDRALAGAERAAAWLQALQQLRVDAADAPAPESARYIGELAAAQPEHRARIERAGGELARALDRDGGHPVLSHGDYHPMNVYVAPDGQVTAIDLDTFARREPAADIAYFIAQTAIIGLHALNSIEATAEVRRCFLSAAPRVDPERASIHVRFAFLRSLHYDLCILKTGATGSVEPFLRIVEHGLEP